jgi:hypothetical protein
MFTAIDRAGKAVTADREWKSGREIVATARDEPDACAIATPA